MVAASDGPIVYECRNCEKQVDKRLSEFDECPLCDHREFVVIVSEW